MTEDLGWAPVPRASLPWNDIDQLILFNLATSNGPGLDKSNIAVINVPVWVATVHAHPGIKAIIAIGGAGNDNWGPRATTRTGRSSSRTSSASRPRTGSTESTSTSRTSPVQARAAEPRDDHLHRGDRDGRPRGGSVRVGGRDHELAGPGARRAQADIDQFNLMTYGDDLATVQQDVADTIQPGAPGLEVRRRGRRQ